MRIRQLVLLALIASILFNLAACDNHGNPRSKVLTLYRLESDKLFSRGLVKYNKTHNRTTIKELVYPDDQVDKYQKEITGGVASGGGPDILIFPEGMKRVYLEHLISQGLLEDMDVLISKDGDFKLSDYNVKAMEAGVFNGKRVLMPLSFCVPALLTTSEALQENNITMEDGGCTWENFAQKAKNYMSSSNGNYFINNLKINSLIDCSGVPVADYKDRLSLVDKDEFKNLLSTYAKSGINDCIYRGNEIGLLQTGKVVMEYNDIRNPKHLFSGFENQVTPEIYQVPSIKGDGKSVAKVNCWIAINKNCKDKQAAFEYVKTLLTKEMQTDFYMFNIPVNNQAFEQYKKTLASGSVNIIMQRVVEQFDKLIASITKYEMFNYELYDILKQPIAMYITGQISLEDALEELRKKIPEYFNKTPIPKVGRKEDNNSGKDSSKLKIYYMMYEKSIKNTVRAFGETNAGLSIDAKEFQDFEEYRNKLTTEIMAGEGPDVIINSTGAFNSVLNVVENGVLVDLNELISEDSDFKLKDYFENIMNAGVFEGKRYFLPYQYLMHYIFSTEEIMQKENIRIDESNWTYKEWAELFSEYRIKHPGKTSYLSAPSGYPLFSVIVNSVAGAFIDYNQKKCSFDSVEFIELLKYCKQIDNGSYPVEEIRKNQMVPDTNEYLLSSNSVKMIENRSLGSPWNIFNNFNSCTKLKPSSKMVLLPFPVLRNGDKLPVERVSMAGINSKSSNKNAAYLLLKFLLSKEMQTWVDNYGNMNFLMGSPVNKLAYEEDKKYFMSKKVKEINKGIGNLIPMTSDIAVKMDKMVQRADCTNTLLDNEIINIINDEVFAFYDSKKTAEQAAEEVNHKVTLFLNE